VEINQAEINLQMQRFLAFRKKFPIYEIPAQFSEIYKHSAFGPGKVLNTFNSGTNDLIIVLKGRLLAWTLPKQQDLMRDFYLQEVIHEGEVCNEFSLLDKKQYICIFMRWIL